MSKQDNALVPQQADMIIDEAALFQQVSAIIENRKERAVIRKIV